MFKHTTPVIIGRQPTAEEMVIVRDVVETHVEPVLKKFVKDALSKFFADVDWTEEIRSEVEANKNDPDVYAKAAQILTVKSLQVSEVAASVFEEDELCAYVKTCGLVFEDQQFEDHSEHRTYKVYVNKPMSDLHDGDADVCVWKSKNIAFLMPWLNEAISKMSDTDSFEDIVAVNLYNRWMLEAELEGVKKHCPTSNQFVKSCMREYRGLYKTRKEYKRHIISLINRWNNTKTRNLITEFGVDILRAGIIGPVLDGQVYVPLAGGVFPILANACSKQF